MTPERDILLHSGDAGSPLIGVVGAGLLGTSIIDLVLSEIDDAQVRFVEANPVHSKVVAERFSRAEPCAKLDYLAACDLVLVCTPPGVTAPILIELLNQQDSAALIIDTASTKRAIMADVLGSGADTARYVGGHPLAGGNRLGPSDAGAHKLRGATFILSPHGALPQENYRRAELFLERLGFQVLEMAADRHDQMLSLTSHLPHLIAYAYTSTLAQDSGLDDAEMAKLASRSTKTMAKFASENGQMWTDVFRGNDALAGWLEAFIGNLQRLQKIAAEESETDLLQELSHISDYKTRAGLDEI